MAYQLPALMERAHDSSGLLAGAKMYVYLAGTTTLVDCYTTPALNVAHPNPLVADAGGLFAQAFFAAGSYKIVFKTSAGVTIQERDNYVVQADGGEFEIPVVVKTANFNVSASDQGKAFLVDASGAPGSNISVSADSDDLGANFPFFVLNTGATGTITIEGVGGQTVDGAANQVLSVQYSSVGLVSIGASGWLSVMRSNINSFIAPVTFSSAAPITANAAATFNETVTFNDDMILSSVTLTDAATIDWNLSLGSRFQVTLGGDRTLNAPTGEASGQWGFLTVIQDATGGRTLTWNAAYKFQANIAQRPDPGASSHTNYMYRVLGDNSLQMWRLYADTQGPINGWKEYDLGANALSTDYVQGHGLGRYPSSVEVYLECTSANLNYAVGDRLLRNSATDSGGNEMVTVHMNTTNVEIHTGANAIAIINRTSNVFANITTANWKWIIRVYE